MLLTKSRNNLFEHVTLRTLSIFNKFHALVLWWNEHNNSHSRPQSRLPLLVGGALA